MNLTIGLAAIAAAVAAPEMAGSALTPGDTLDLQYQYPKFGHVFQDSGDFTYTGPGQSIGTQAGISTVVLSNNAVAFEESPGCGPDCFQNRASWNGPVLFDLSNGVAFDGWTVLRDTVGITSSVIGGGVVGVNWQGVPVQGEVVVGVPVPEPAAWAMLILGVATLGAALRTPDRRQAWP